MELLSESIPCLLLILNIEESFDLVNLLLYGVDLLRFHLKLLPFYVEVSAALDDLLLNSSSSFSALEFTESCLLVDRSPPFNIGILPLAHASQHSILFLLQDHFILGLLLLLPVLHGSDFCLFFFRHLYLSDGL